MAPINSLGAVVVFDGEVPRTFTATALNTISGGEFVAAVGDNNVVGSGLSSYADGDITIGSVIANTKGIEIINGIALNTATSGNIVTVATRGAYLTRAGGSVLPGMIVEALTSDFVQTVGSQTIPSGKHTGVPGAKNIGRAITAAASGTNQYSLVYYNF